MSTPDAFPWASPPLKEQLLRDPRAVLKDRGLNVPAEVPLPVVHEFVRVLHLLWVDGKVTPIDRFYIDPQDAGLLFGRGVWESTRTVGGIPWLWPMHLDRMRQTAALLGIDLAPDRLPTDQQVSEYVRSLTGQDVVIRLNATAGRPGKPGLVWMSAAVQPAAVESLRLMTTRSPVQKGQAYLTLKTFQYATRLQIGQLAHARGFDTALLVDEDGNLLEASHANIFLRFADGWATPAANGGLLPGTVRQFLLARSPQSIAERAIPVSLLKDAQEIFVTNSNVGLVPVTQIDDLTFPIGAETIKLKRWIEPPDPPGVQYRFRETRPA